MHQAEIVEVVVRVRLALLLVHDVPAGDVILPRRVGAAWMSLQFRIQAQRVLVVDP